MQMSEVCARMGISAETLRYYERIALLPPIARDARGVRDYSEQDLRWIYYVRALRRAGVPVASIQEYVALLQQGEHTREARREILLAQERRLEESIAQQQESLAYLRSKLRNYDAKIRAYEQGLMQKGEPRRAGESDGR